MKRSDLNTSEQRLEGISLLLDETLSGRTILQGLRAANIPVKAHEELFERGIDDIHLMMQLRHHPELYFLTRDRDFRYKPDVVIALQHSGVGAFVLTAAGNKTGPQLAEMIKDAWPVIQRFIKKHKRPFVAKVMGNGAVHLHND